MTPAKPLVPRHRTITKYGAPCSAPYVTDADAAKLEAVVAAADEMRDYARCDSAGCEVVPESCALCKAKRAYDEARKGIEG